MSKQSYNVVVEDFIKRTINENKNCDKAFPILLLPNTTKSKASKF